MNPWSFLTDSLMKNVKCQGSVPENLPLTLMRQRLTGS